MIQLLPAALDKFAQAAVNCNSVDPGCSGNTGLPNVNFTSDSVHTISQIAFGIIGAVAVVIIIIAGISLITSNGDPEAVTKARQTILFASIGLIIAVSAEIIISFVLTRVN